VRAAKRGGLLGEGDEFFGYRAAFDAELPRVRELLRGVAAAHEDAERVYVFAELFGGAYPDSDAAPAAADAAAAAAASEEGDEVEAVQQEILYSPSLRFYYFDIAVESRARGKRYLDYCEACALWEAAGVFYAQPLFLGPLHEALALPTEFPTTLPARLGLRELPGNMAEGLVVMPVCEVDVGGGRRAILKRKSPRFEERVRVFAAGSAASPNASDLTTLLTGFVNRNRVAAARSKLGPRVRDADLAAAVATDAIEDACGDEEVAARWKALSDAQRARTRDVLRQVASDVAAAATKGRGGGRR
jgi:Rnl2 family RNA ligase